MTKRPDLIKRNKSKKQREAVSNYWKKVKPKPLCADCKKVVSTRKTKRCRKCAGLQKIGRFKKNASYSAIHKWVRANKPTDKKCEYCKKKGILHLANKDHKYRRNIDDWVYLCPKCHRDYDVENGLRPHFEGKNHPMYGKKHNEETRKLISKRTKEGMNRIPTTIGE